MGKGLDRVRRVRADRACAQKIERIDKIIAEIGEIPRGPLLTPEELHEKRTAEVLARIFGEQAAADEEDVRPRWAADEHTAPPWMEETTRADDEDQD